MLKIYIMVKILKDAYAAIPRKWRGGQKKNQADTYSNST